MNADRPRILIPIPTSGDAEYNQRSWPQYAQAVEAAGGQPVPFDLTSAPAEQATLLGDAAGILLPGSPADVNPERYGERRSPECAPADALREAADELLLQDAFNLHKPIFGICYGMQSLNVWTGGSLVQHIETDVNHAAGRTVVEAHPIEVEPGTRLAALISASGEAPAAWTNSSHHQSVARVGDRLRMAAWSSSDAVVEAVEGEGGQFVIGVQWHPERTAPQNALSVGLFRSFVEAAAAWKSAPARLSRP